MTELEKEKALIEAASIIRNLLFAPSEPAYRFAAQRWLRDTTKLREGAIRD